MTKEKFISSTETFKGPGGRGVQVEWLYKNFMVILVLQIKVLGSFWLFFGFNGITVIF